MTTNEHNSQRGRNPKKKVDPVEQPTQGDGDDATSGSEGGGPRIGYSESSEADRERHQFPHPPKRKPR
jgi:hypothetical protein